MQRMVPKSWQLCAIRPSACCAVLAFLPLRLVCATTLVIPTLLYTSYPSLLGRTHKPCSAPYINNTLLPMASHAEQDYNPPGIHPSEPNYLWLEAGTNFGITNDADPAANHQSTKLHLVTLLANAHITWKSYQEDISGTVCPLTSMGAYAPKHNPMVFFDDVTNSNDPHSASCIVHVRPYSELGTDLQKNTVARYNFI